MFAVATEHSASANASDSWGQTEPDVPSFSVNYFVHSFPIVDAKMRLVRDGQKSFYSQYLLNPSMGISDLYFVGLMLVLISTVRFILCGAHHPRTRYCPSLLKACFGPVCKTRRESKMTENLWYSFWHTFSFCLGLWVLYSEALTAEHPGWIRLLFTQLDVNWFWFPTLAEVKFLGSPGWPLFPVSSLMRTYYLSELAFWLSCIMFLWIETLRNDFHALLLHHLATCTLIGLSYICSFWRIGTVVLVTHDFADIFLYTAKTIHYTKTPSIIVDLLFFLFVAGFFLSRLVFFPLFCLRPTMSIVNLNKCSSTLPSSNWKVPGGVALPGFLCVLQILHIFWFGLIIKMIIRTARGSKASKEGDIRSDDEGNDDGDQEKEDRAKEKTNRGDDNLMSGSESNGVDERMQLSSLPGVHPITDIPHRRRHRS